MKTDIEDKVKQIICTILENNDCYDRITGETHLVNDIGIDSLQIMQLVVEIEIAFDMEFDDDDLVVENLANVQGLIQLIDKHTH
ncbi:acyl carrier protein [Paenibacillus sp. FSL K6-2524]|uniref:acyl carrier protein n=1 Tax=Paenibacillus sp. FSL K6-2524 TaxID=2954516 RepID=UPI0030F7FDF8